MHDPLDRGMGAIADGVGALLRAGVQLGGIGDELAADRIGGVQRVDEGGDLRGDRHGVAGGYFFQRGHGVERGEARRRQIARTVQPAHSEISATGVQIT